jgi:Tripartite tricarboxylate transporter family receptor
VIGDPSLVTWAFSHSLGTTANASNRQETKCEFKRLFTVYWFTVPCYFTPITLMARYPYIITSTASRPVRTVQELIALAKARPAELSYASSGNGSGPHMGFELFKNAARINVVHVPCLGTTAKAPSHQESK